MGQTINVDFDLIKAAIAELRISNSKPQAAVASALEAVVATMPDGTAPALFSHYEAMAIDAALARFGVNSFLCEFSTDKDVRDAIASLCKVVRERVPAPEAISDVE
ncbi:hypothetical protein [Achromobacter sp. UBA4530]|uniref:hypothetical protein n=1 Tax=Achromobacter sp. UBA4530 TaxID=1945912 RepID=UPI00257FA0A3|nr:hypothetical protein [Achromobacter sp. UBA4530]